jgi:hypothetical protein
MSRVCQNRQYRNFPEVAYTAPASSDQAPAARLASACRLLDLVFFRLAASPIEQHYLCERVISFVAAEILDADDFEKSLKQAPVPSVARRQFRVLQGGAR